MAFSTDPVTIDPPDMGLREENCRRGSHRCDRGECRSSRARPARRSCRFRCRYPACRTGRKRAHWHGIPPCAVHGRRSATQLAPARPQPRIFAVAPHRADLRRAPFPAEFLCAHFKAFAKMPRRERHLLVFVFFGVVQNAQACSGSIFSSSANSFIADSSAYKSRNCAGAAHIHGRAHVAMHNSARHFQGSRHCRDKAWPRRSLRHNRRAWT